ncbi:MAG: energy-coupling factor transporter ATPase [Syntrophomonadaceae bacterium]|jgi:energy-coupling factor transport system ATP-binding protein
MIRLDKVIYYYPGSPRAAIQNISLELNKGDFTVIMGRNASGKSTLARLLNGLLLPDSGRVEVDGLDTGNPSHINEIRKKVGLLFAEPDNQLVSNLVEEDVAFGPENLGLPSRQIKARVDTALKLVSMEDYKKYPPHLLSGGQKQRVCIAGLLALQPEYMVLDEPTSMLDTKSRREVMETFCRFRRKMGTSIVLITHHFEDALQADRIIVLDQGQVQLDTKPLELLSKADHLKALGLEPAPLTSLIAQINQDSGLNIPVDIVEIEHLVNILCQLK